MPRAPQTPGSPRSSSRGRCYRLVRRTGALELEELFGENVSETEPSAATILAMEARTRSIFVLSQDLADAPASKTANPVQVSSRRGAPGYLEALPPSETATFQQALP